MPWLPITHARHITPGRQLRSGEDCAVRTIRRVAHHSARHCAVVEFTDRTALPLRFVERYWQVRADG